MTRSVKEGDQKSGTPFGSRICLTSFLAGEALSRMDANWPRSEMQVCFIPGYTYIGTAVARHCLHSVPEACIQLHLLY